MPSLLLELHIRPDDMLDYYRGRAQVVHATASDGRTVEFPARALQQYVTQDGIHGWFELEFDGRHKFIRLAPSDPSRGPQATRSECP